MSCKFEMDVFCTHVFGIVFNLSMYKMLVLEFPLRSPMNKLSKIHRALWVFQLYIHGGSAPTLFPLVGALQKWYQSNNPTTLDL